MSGGAPPAADRRTLAEVWELRLAAATTLMRVEDLVREELATAEPAELVALLDRFSTSRSPGADWSRSIVLLVEHLWAWCPEEVLVTVATEFEARGAMWVPLVKMLSPAYGAGVRDELRRRSAQTRTLRFTIG